MKFVQPEHPLYRPLRNRLIICGATLVWFVLELWHGDGFWSVIAGAAAAFCIWTFLITWKPHTPESKE